MCKCEVNLIRFREDKTAVNMVYDMEVSCNNKEECGCGWRGRLGELAEHLVWCKDMIEERKNGGEGSMGIGGEINANAGMSVGGNVNANNMYYNSISHYSTIRHHTMHYKKT